MSYREGTMRPRYLTAVVLLAACPGFAAIGKVTVQATSMQAVLAYTAPDRQPCRVEIRETPSLAPLVNDVNPALFAGADMDNRAGSISLGRWRTFVAGTRRAEASGDTRFYSRTLQVNTVHYYRITCGAETATGSFQTANMPVGNGWIEPPRPDAARAGKTALPTLNQVPRNGTIVDPHTGVLLKRVSVPGDSHAPTYDLTAGCESASGTNWSTAGAACSATDSGASATYSGGGTDILKLVMSTAFYGSLPVDYVKLTVTGSGTAAAAADRTIQVCISLDQATCATPWKEVALDTAATAKTVCRTVPCDGTPQAIDTWRDPGEEQIRGSQIDAGLCGNCKWAFLIRKKTAGGSVSIGSISAKIGTSPPTTTSASGNHEVCSPRTTAGGYFLCTGVTNGGAAKGLYTIHADTGEAHYMGRIYASDYTRKPYVSNTPLVQGTDEWDKNDPTVLYMTAIDDAGKSVLMKGVFGGNPAADAAAEATANFQWTNLTPGSYSLDDQALVRDPTYRAGAWIAMLMQNNRLVMEALRGYQDSYGWVAVYDPGNGLPLGNGGNGRFVAMTAPHRMYGCRWASLHQLSPVGNQDVVVMTTKHLSGGGVGFGPYQVKLVNGASATDTVLVVTSDNPSPKTGEPYSPNADNYLMDADVDDLLSVSAEVIRITGKTRLDESRIQYTVERGYGGTQAGALAAGTALTFDSGGTTDRFDHTIKLHGNGGMCMWRYLDDPQGTDKTGMYNWGAPFLAHEAARWNRVAHGQAIAESAPGTNAFYEGRGSAIAYTLAQAPFFGGKYAPHEGATFQGYPSYGQESAAAIDREWYLDTHSFIGGNLISCWSGDAGSPNCSSNTCDPNVDEKDARHCAAMRVGGASCGAASPATCNTYRYLTRNFGSGYDPIDRKFLPTYGLCGTEWLADISGPGSVIDDSRESVFCVAQAAGECRPDSQPGYAYVRCRNLQRFYSSSGEGLTGTVDVSLNDFPATGSAVTLYGFSPNREGARTGSDATWRGFGYSRVLTQMVQPLHAMVAASKALPNGKWALFATNGVERTDVWVAKIPPFPQKDSVDRTQFVPLSVQLTPPAGLRVDNAIVQFGYAENGDAGDLYCTTRQEPCVAKSDMVGAEPFVFPVEAGGENGIAGMRCTSGCTIAIPGLPQHVVYYRVKYRDASNRVLAQTPLQVAAVP